MNKAELIAAVSEKAQLTHKQTDTILSATFDTIVESVSSGDKLVLVGFGSFEVRERQAREGRNPKTGDKMAISAKMVPVFTAGEAFKDSVKPPV